MPALNKQYLICFAFLALITQSLHAHPGGHGVHAYSPADHSANANDDLVFLVALGILLFTSLFTLSRLGIAWTRPISGLALLVCLVIGLSACAQRASRPKGPRPQALDHFLPFKDQLQLNWDGDWLLVGSNGFPDHPMMIGITAWQQQVPLPQPYTKTNSWRIPLHPKLADKPISAKKALFSGAIALAVNGVPIFNALNNRGEDAYLAGELDDYGGHCGRGDDYHYHAAPVHLEKVVGKGNPIGYALDGYPLFGFADAKGNPPSDLDEFNGRMENGSYRYYSTKTFPYINGGLRGEITVRGDRVDPQPKDRPVRMARQPLKDAKITDFVRDEARKTYTVKYDIRGAEHLVQYTIKKDGTYSFTYQNNLGVKTTQEYKQQDKSAGKWEKGKEGKEDKGKKEGKKEGKGPGGKAGDL